MVSGIAKAVLLVLIAGFLLVGTASAQNDSGASNTGYGSQAPPNQPMQPQGGGYGYGSQGGTGYGQQGAPSQSGGQGFNAGQQGNGFGMGNSSPIMSNFQMGFEQQGFTGVDPAAYVDNLIGLGMYRQLVSHRTELDMSTNCLDSASQAKIVDALVNYYNQSGSDALAKNIYDRRKEAVTTLCNNTDYCSQGFDFMQGAPPEVRAAIKENPSLKVDITASPSVIQNNIEAICKAVMGKQIENQKAQMEKQAEQVAKQYLQECERAKQQQQQMQQQQNQRQNQQPGNYGPGGPNGGPTTPCPMGTNPVNQNNQWTCVPNNNGGSGQGGSSCPPGQYWNPSQSACVSGGQNCPSNTHWDGTTCQPNDQSGQCPQGQQYDPNTNNCASNEGGGGQQGPFCGDGICNEDPNSCVQDCGQQGGGNGGNGGSDGGPACGNGACETGEDGTNCPADCGGGGLASDVLNRMFGNNLFSVTALVSMLQLQENNGQQCPAGEYWGTNDQGMQSCIAGGQGTAAGGGFGFGSQPQGGYQGSGGFGRSGPGGQGGMMPSQGFGGGPGFGSLNFDEICASSDIQGKIKTEMLSQFDGMENMTNNCKNEAQQRSYELSMLGEQALVNKETCKINFENNCAQGKEILKAFEQALQNVRPVAEKFVGYQCSVFQLRAANAQKDSYSQMALALDDLTQQAAMSQDGTIASSATAMGLLDTQQRIKKSQDDAGIARWFIESSTVKAAQAEAAKALEKNLATIQNLKKQGNLTTEQQQKLSEIETKMLAEKAKATNCQNASILPSVFGC